MEDSVLAQALIAALHSSKSAAPSEGQRARWLVGAAPEYHRKESVTAIESGSWAGLDRLATAEVKARQKSLRDIRTAAVAVTEQRRILEELDIVFRSEWKTTKMKDNAELSTGLKRHGFPPAKVKAALALRAQATPRVVLRSAMGRLEYQFDSLDRIAQGHARNLSGAIQASMVARFNSVVPAGPQRRVVVVGRREVGRAWSAMARAVRDGSRVETILAATSLGRIAQRLIPTTISAAAHNATIVAGAHPRVGDLRAAIELGNWLRSLSVATMAAVRIQWLAIACGIENTAWSSPPDAPAFAADLRPVTSLRSVMRNEVPEGQEIMVEGILDSVAISHRNRKALSLASVRDRTGNSIAVVLPYIKLDSGGLSPSSPVRLTGTWRASSPESDGPALHLGRVSRSAAGTASIEGWATWLLRGIYEPVAHSLSAEWGWIRGIDGPANPIRYGVWYDRGVSHG